MLHGTEYLSTSSPKSWVDVARHCGTDQIIYMTYFWEHMHRLESAAFTMLEIGVYQGQSLEVWKHIFPAAKIHALDINPDCTRYADPPRVEITIGSQNDPAVLEAWAGQVDGPIDVIIDDGSHVMEHLKTSFTHLFPKLRSGGLYVLEDLGACYMPEYGGKDLKEETRYRKFKRFAKGLIHGLDAFDKMTMMELLKSYVDNINASFSGIDNPLQIDHIHFYENVYFVYKK
jgi:Methyltransferase domain